MAEDIAGLPTIPWLTAGRCPCGGACHHAVIPCTQDCVAAEQKHRQGLTDSLEKITALLEDLVEVSRGSAAETSYERAIERWQRGEGPHPDD